MNNDAKITLDICAREMTAEQILDELKVRVPLENKDADIQKTLKGYIEQLIKHKLVLPIKEMSEHEK